MCKYNTFELYYNTFRSNNFTNKQTQLWIPSRHKQSNFRFRSRTFNTHDRPPITDNTRKLVRRGVKSSLRASLLGERRELFIKTKLLLNCMRGPFASVTLRIPCHWYGAGKQRLSSCGARAELQWRGRMALEGLKGELCGVPFRNSGYFCRFRFVNCVVWISGLKKALFEICF